MADAAPEVAIPSGPEPARWSKRRIGLMLVVPVLLLAFGVWYWLSREGLVATDNAYVRQDKVAVSAQVGGPIVKVAVREGQAVHAGDLLFAIDPEPYRLQIAEAEAAIAAAQADVTALRNATPLSGADIAAARENIAFAQARFERQAALWQRGFTTKADYDAARHAVAQAQSELHVAEAERAEASARLALGAAMPNQYPQIAAAEARKASAMLDLRRTEVRAPIAGRVAQSTRLQPGQQVVPNLPILTLMADGQSYVEANFKEGDLAEMAVGQPAEVHFDAYPSLTLKGHVESIGAGTGSEFSVLPAQNATGNWVKITQRVPVRIALDEQSPRHLIAGLSSEVSVFTHRPKSASH